MESVIITLPLFWKKSINGNQALTEIGAVPGVRCVFQNNVLVRSLTEKIVDYGDGRLGGCRNYRFCCCSTKD